MEMVNEPNIQHRCRICLASEAEEFVSLQCRCDSLQMRLIEEMMQDLTGAECTPAKQNDGLPQYICKDCFESLYRACAFQNRDFVMNRHLKNQYLLREVKIESRCRICAVIGTNKPYSLYRIYEEGNVMISDMMERIFGVSKPNDQDKLPQNICGKCFHQLVDAYKFRELILRSNMQLRSESRNFLLSSSVKNRPIKAFQWRLPIKQGQIKGEIDPLMYLELHTEFAPLLSQFYIIEEAELYDRLQFHGVICCCGELYESEERLSRHRKSCPSIKCPDSLKRFQSAGDLQKHQAIQHQKLFYRCKICNILTKERSDLELHCEFTRFHVLLDSSEEERKKFDEQIETVYKPDNRCCECHQQFDNGSSLIDHAKEIHFNNVEKRWSFVCMICYRSFSNGRLLFEHQQTFSGTRTYICRRDDCQFKTKQRADAKKHIEVGLHCTVNMLVKAEPERESSPEEYFCCVNRCHEVLPSRQDLENHCANEHKEQITSNSLLSKVLTGFSCPLCKRSFSNQSMLESHIRTQTKRNYICCNCGNKYATRESLMSHEKRHAVRSVTFSCEICDARFREKRTLNIHIRRDHEKILPEACPSCEKRFVTTGELRMHIKLKHLKHPWKCTTCQSAFATKQLLQKHTKTHTDERPFECKYCPKTYRHAPDLKRHEMVIHLGEKPFRCELCPASFVRNRDLQLHMTVHTGKKFYTCSICSFSTNNSKKLSIHYQEEHL